MHKISYDEVGADPSGWSVEPSTGPFIGSPVERVPGARGTQDLGGRDEPLRPCDASPGLGLRLGLGLEPAVQRHYPDPALLKPAAPVTGAHPEMPRLAAALIRAMQQWGVRALAAPQLGIDGRVVVVALDDGPVCLVNPRIEPLSREITVIENCLIRPGVEAVAQRHRRVRVTGWDAQRTLQVFDLEGPAALALQHAVDHLDGRVICREPRPLEEPSVRGKGDGAALA